MAKKKKPLRLLLLPPLKPLLLLPLPPLLRPTPLPLRPLLPLPTLLLRPPLPLLPPKKRSSNPAEAFASQNRPARAGRFFCARACLGTGQCPSVPLGCQPQFSFLTSTRLRRSQLYLRLRASGSQSGSTGWKPRLMNQCMVRVVSTKMLSSPM